MNNIKLVEDMGFTEKQVRQLLGSEYDKFETWMRGQTLGLVEDIPVFYYCDVDKWMRYCR